MKKQTRINSSFTITKNCQKFWLEVINRKKVQLNQCTVQLNWFSLTLFISSFTESDNLRYRGRAYSRSLFGATIARSLVPWVMKKIFSLLACTHRKTDFSLKRKLASIQKKTSFHPKENWLSLEEKLASTLRKIDFHSSGSYSLFKGYLGSTKKKKNSLSLEGELAFPKGKTGFHLSENWLSLEWKWIKTGFQSMENWLYSNENWLPLKSKLVFTPRKTGLSSKENWLFTQRKTGFHSKESCFPLKGKLPSTHRTNGFYSKDD